MTPLWMLGELLLWLAGVLVILAVLFMAVMGAACWSMRKCADPVGDDDDVDEGLS